MAKVNAPLMRTAGSEIALFIAGVAIFAWEMRCGATTLAKALRARGRA